MENSHAQRQMQFQHVNVKLLVQNPGEIDLEPLIPVFHGWIQDQAQENCCWTLPITGTCRRPGSGPDRA